MILRVIRGVFFTLAHEVRMGSLLQAPDPILDPYRQVLGLVSGQYQRGLTQVLIPRNPLALVGNGKAALEVLQVVKMAIGTTLPQKKVYDLI